MDGTRGTLTTRSRLLRYLLTLSTLYSLLKPFIHPFIKTRIQTGIADAASAYFETSFKKLVSMSTTETETVEVGKIKGPAPEYASKAFDVTAEGA